MRAQYPEEMTVVLQHQFWDLKVNEDGFEVGLSFGGIPERVVVPFQSIKGFADPSVQFGVQFELLTPVETAEEEPESTPERAPPARPPAEHKHATPDVAALPTPANPPPDKPGSGADVVRLDRFRKK
jgi:hypothetical protein